MPFASILRRLSELATFLPARDAGCETASITKRARVDHGISKSYPSELGEHPPCMSNSHPISQPILRPYFSWN